ncbi:hypothetical protein MTR67_048284 [Solanum verrucosum]|uniref:Uncharacterized protein n=1 Tax=Solanum verrucosum TaxID=315347 RepID=A0AAF0V0J7_SOLVR|nr:hypothetical protein MTR67_048284 [Solanum verrucosum]
MHIGSFGELGRALQTTRRFTEVPHLAFNSMPNKYLGFVTFREKLEVAKTTRRLDESFLFRYVSMTLNLKIKCNFRRANICLPNAVGDSLDDIPIADKPNFSELFEPIFLAGPI